MLGNIFNGAVKLLLLSDRVDRFDRRQDKSDARWEELIQRVNTLTMSLVRLEERMAGWERHDRTERENLVLKLRQELADYRPQLPPPTLPAGGSQT